MQLKIKLFMTYLQLMQAKVNFAVVKDITVGKTAATAADAKIAGVYLKVVDPEYAKALIKDVKTSMELRILMTLQAAQLLQLLISCRKV